LAAALALQGSPTGPHLCRRLRHFVPQQASTPLLAAALQLLLLHHARLHSQQVLLRFLMRQEQGCMPQLRTAWPLQGLKAAY
jgi:hypothetical protein